MADTLMLVERPAGHREGLAGAADPGCTLHVELGARHDPHDLDQDAPPGSLRASFQPGGSAMTFRDGFVISNAVRRWVHESRRCGAQAAPHDVVVTSRDPHGAVVARWCLRRAVPAPARRRPDRELVFTCEWIDLLAADAVATAPVFERRRSACDGTRHPWWTPGTGDGVVTAAG